MQVFKGDFDPSPNRDVDFNIEGVGQKNKGNDIVQGRCPIFRKV